MSEHEQLRVHLAGINIIHSVEGVITGLFKDLGESPEAVRGAGCVAEMCRQMMLLITETTATPSERDIDAEMSTAGVVCMLLMANITKRIALTEGS